MTNRAPAFVQEIKLSVDDINRILAYVDTIEKIEPSQALEVVGRDVDLQLAVRWREKW